MGKTLLLVEDNPTDEKLTLRIFKKVGLINDVVVVRDGAEALDYLFAGGRYKDRASDTFPAVVFLDLKLPRISGLEVLRRLREDARACLVPVVVLTASTEEEDVIKSYQLGANGYVRKAVDALQFTETARALSQFWLGINQAAPYR